MANIINRLFGFSEPRNVAEQSAAENAAPSGGVTGLLAGSLAASVFGGPVGLAIGLASGLASNRFRSAAVDATAADQASLDEYSRDLYTQFKSAAEYVARFGDEQDAEMLNAMESTRRRWSKMTEHPDPSMRHYALEQMAALDARYDSFHQSIRERTDEIADRAYEERKAQRDRIQTQATKHMDQILGTREIIDTLAEVYAREGADSPLTQAKAAELGSLITRDEEGKASINLGIFGGSFKFGEDKLTDTQISNLIAASEAGLKRREQYIQSLYEEGVKDGFQMQSRNGQVAVTDLDRVTDDFRASRPTPPVSRGDPNNTVPGAPDVLKRVPVVRDIIDEMRGRRAQREEALGPPLQTFPPHSARDLRSDRERRRTRRITN